MGSPPTKAPNAAGVGKMRFSNLRDALPPETRVHPPQSSVSTTARWRINTQCRQQRWSSTKFVYNTYDSRSTSHPSCPLHRKLAFVEHDHHSTNDPTLKDFSRENLSNFANRCVGYKTRL